MRGRAINSGVTVMPLTNKGSEILSSMRKTYGSEKKAKEVLYASRNTGTITGIDDQIGNYMDAVRRGDAAGMRDCFQKKD